MVRKKRPPKLLGFTEVVETGCGSLHFTLNRDEYGYYEVFINMGKAGSCANVQNGAMARILALCLQEGVDLPVIVGQLRGIRCPNPSMVGGKFVLSCADGVANILENNAKELQRIAEAEVKSEEGSGKSAEKSAEKKGSSSSGYTQLELPLDVRNERKGNSVGECPECSCLLVCGDGCVYCPSCGYERCG
jgi:ribonucleoside-diphosphate reductase alpha chain